MYVESRHVCMYVCMLYVCRYNVYMYVSNLWLQCILVHDMEENIVNVSSLLRINYFLLGLS